MFKEFLSKVARRSSGVHLFVLITNLVCVGVTLLRGAPVYFLRRLGRLVSFRVTQFSGEEFLSFVTR